MSASEDIDVKAYCANCDESPLSLGAELIAFDRYYGQYATSITFKVSSLTFHVVMTPENWKRFVKKFGEIRYWAARNNKIYSITYEV